MLFHTWPFLVFMLVVLPVFYLLRPTPLWIPWLLTASYFFYAWWNPYYLLLVIYSTALDYSRAGSTLMRTTARASRGVQRFCLLCLRPSALRLRLEEERAGVRAIPRRAGFFIAQFTAPRIPCSDSPSSSQPDSVCC